MLSLALICPQKRPIDLVQSIPNVPFSNNKAQAQIFLCATEPKEKRELLTNLGASVQSSTFCRQQHRGAPRAMLDSQSGILWCSMQEQGRKPNTLDLKRMATSLRTIYASGRIYVVEGPAQAWPDTDLIPQRVVQNLTTVSTCGMAAPGQIPCVKYLVASNISIPEVQCRCEQEHLHFNDN